MSAMSSSPDSRQHPVEAGSIVTDHPEAPFHDEHGDREVAPIRPFHRPHPIDAISAIVIAGSLVGAVAIPGLIVSPTATTAPGNKLGLAFGITMVGILIAVLTGIFQYRRTGNWVWYLVAATPAFAVFCGGAIFAATKAVA
jgi:hypothetical protein